MKEEIGSTIDNLDNLSKKKFGDLEIFNGLWRKNSNEKLYVSLAFSGWGKVSAARATTRLIASNLNQIPINILFFTGVAGALSERLNQWDLIIPNQLIQYDMDARPLFDKFVIPALGTSKLISNLNWSEWTLNTLNNYFNEKNLKEFGSLHRGLIATGDQFISEKNKVESILRENPEVLAVEMEGASFAQVAEQEKIPWQIIRVISDKANEESPIDFNKFLLNYKKISAHIVSALLDNMGNGPF